MTLSKTTLKNLINKLSCLRKIIGTFLTPEEFLDYKIKKKKIYGKNLLLTFDDGFFSNITVSQKIFKKIWN